MIRIFAENAARFPAKVMMLLFVFVLLFAVDCPSVIAAGPFSPARTNAVPLTKPPIQEVGEGVFQLGDVRLDKNTKSVSFAGYVNMSTGVVEYAVVGSHGKLHESVLATEAQPYHIHLAMLLLGATNQSAQVESGRRLSGHPIHIWVTWPSHGKGSDAGHPQPSQESTAPLSSPLAPRAEGGVRREDEPVRALEISSNRVHKVRLEDLICKGQPGKTMSRGIWIYNGSRVVDGTFLAQRDESIITIIDDPDAMVNNPRKGRENDEIWFVNEKTVPPIQTPVRITVELQADRN